MSRLVIHHLGRSQSERVVWLCEELGLDYELKRYSRDPVTILAPPDFKALHPLGAAPVIDDGEVRIAESAAVVEYILARHGGGRLRPSADDPSFPTYLAFFHFANGTLQPVLSRNMVVARLDPPADHAVRRDAARRLDGAFRFVDDRLSKSAYLAGPELTAADIMTVFSLSTMRSFVPVDLGPYPSIRRYLGSIGERPGYRRAMEKGDPGMALLLD